MLILWFHYILLGIYAPAPEIHSFPSLNADACVYVS